VRFIGYLKTEVTHDLRQHTVNQSFFVFCQVQLSPTALLVNRALA
jgi:hypothetical protein